MSGLIKAKLDQCEYARRDSLSSICMLCIGLQDECAAQVSTSGTKVLSRESCGKGISWLDQKDQWC